MNTKVMLPVKVNTEEFTSSELIVTVCDICFSLVPEEYLAEHANSLHSEG